MHFDVSVSFFHYIKTKECSNMFNRNVTMDIMCKRCKRKTDATDFPAHKIAIKCECGGWLITPTGTFDAQLVYHKFAFSLASKNLVSVIISESLENAIAYFENLHDEKVDQTHKINPINYQDITFTNTIKNEEGHEEEIIADLCDLIFSCNQDNLEVAHMTMDEYIQRF
jgi:ribosomal protein S27E